MLLPADLWSLRPLLSCFASFHMWAPSLLSCPTPRSTISYRSLELECCVKLSQGNTVLKRKALKLSIRTHSFQCPSTARFHTEGRARLRQHNPRTHTLTHSPMKLGTLPDGSSLGLSPCSPNQESYVPFAQVHQPKHSRPSQNNPARAPVLTTARAEPPCHQSSFRFSLVTLFLPC